MLDSPLAGGCSFTILDTSSIIIIISYDKLCFRFGQRFYKLIIEAQVFMSPKYKSTKYATVCKYTKRDQAFD